MDKNNKQFGLILPKSKQGASSNAKKPVANIFKQDSSSEDDETKGQLISKCPYEKSVSSKIPTKIYLDFCPKLSGGFQ